MSYEQLEGLLLLARWAGEGGEGLKPRDVPAILSQKVPTFWVALQDTFKKDPVMGIPLNKIILRDDRTSRGMVSYILLIPKGKKEEYTELMSRGFILYSFGKRFVNRFPTQEEELQLQERAAKKKTSPVPAETK